MRCVPGWTGRRVGSCAAAAAAPWAAPGGAFQLCPVSAHVHYASGFLPHLPQHSILVHPQLAPATVSSQAPAASTSTRPTLASFPLDAPPR